VTALPADQLKMVKAMQAQIPKLKAKGLNSINVYNYWLGRRIAPLRARSTLMCEYTGANDPMRMTPEEWSNEEYTKALAKVSSTKFSSFKEPLLPFEPKKNPAPEVNPVTCFFAFRNHLQSLSLHC
jgi:hypothetical protein